MVASMKLPNFRGIGNEDTDHLWFVTKVVWQAQQINNIDIRKVQLATAFQDCALYWYIRYTQANHNATLEKIKASLKEQFKKPKSYTQLVIEMKEIH